MKIIKRYWKPKTKTALYKGRVIYTDTNIYIQGVAKSPYGKPNKNRYDIDNSSASVRISISRHLLLKHYEAI